MATTIVPAVAQASMSTRNGYTDAVGLRFEAVGEFRRYALTLASVEELSGGTRERSTSAPLTRFGLMFAAATPPPAGVYRLSAVDAPGLADAQLFVAASARTRSGTPHRLAGRRP